jgi:threonine aldolase
MSIRINRSFVSDNSSGVHPKILEAIITANDGHVTAYGDDPYTDSAKKKFREYLGENIDVYFVFGGTGANVLGLKAVTKPHHAIICADTAHINVDECGAPENSTGCKLLSVPNDGGKINVENINQVMRGIDDEHHVQPRVISISQSTEMGTVYTAREIQTLAAYAHDHNMFLHMDGARVANAAVSLKAELRTITTDAGVDLLSFGGAKNGTMYGEAVVFFNRDLSVDFKYIRKQGMQLASKMRFISAQFEALLSNDVWKENAAHANRMAKIMASKLKKIPELKITQKVDANAVFVRLPQRYRTSLLKQYSLSIWNEETLEVRFMTSFDTTEEDINNLIAQIKVTVK